jgi:hypothetical protein
MGESILSDRLNTLIVENKRKGIRSKFLNNDSFERWQQNKQTKVIQKNK